MADYTSKYSTGAAVDEALDAGVAAKKIADQNKTDILSVNGKINSLTLGLHTDGLFYIFINNEPIGNGISLPETSGNVYGNIDSENNIILNGNLADGTYTIKYEMADGSTIDIGELMLDTPVEPNEPEEIINWIPISTDSSGAIYNNTGYKSATRLSSDGVTERSVENKICVLTGYIPVNAGDTIYMKNVTVGADSDTTYISYLWLYNSTFTKISQYMYSSQQFSPTSIDGISVFTVPDDTGVAYIRVQAQVLDNNSIITKNQEII